MSVYSLLPNTCTIQRPTFGKDSISGAPKVASWTSYAGIRCNIQVNTEREWQADREAGYTVLDIFFTMIPSSTLATIYNTDRIINADGYPNAEIEIVSAGVDHVGRRSYLFVRARTITGKPTR